jgi:UDP-N-acetylglucosamine--dolichyl-phosphate N-acetylglucosaminephosphotransferase
MTSYALLIPLVISYLLVLSLMPYWMRKVRSIGLIWKDMNKTGEHFLCGSGGVIALLSFLIGSLSYIAYRVFFLGDHNGLLVGVFALLFTTIFMGFIGFIDDLFGWQKGGLSMRSRLVLAILGSIPLIAINAGKSNIVLPFLGAVELGWIYPLVLIPIGIVATTTTFNMFAGFNGLEAGQGVLMLGAIAVVAYFTGNPWLSILCLCMVFALLGFLAFNSFPARVLPGDVLTYALGALIGGAAILGNFERIAVFFYIPYICEVCLKLRGGLKKYSFGKPQEDGSLDLLYDQLYSLNHVSIVILKKLGMTPTEKRAVYLLWIFQLIIILLGFFLFRASIFV